MNTFSTINQKTTKNLQQPGVVQIIVQPEGCTLFSRNSHEGRWVDFKTNVKSYLRKST